MHQTFGAGPFLVSDNIQLAWAELRGVAGNFVHTSAYGQWGDVMLELVQQDSEGPSPFRDMFEPCLLYTSPSPRDATLSRMPSSA